MSSTTSIPISSAASKAKPLPANQPRCASTASASAANAASVVARIDEPDKNWKFSPGDVAESALWDKYMAAYQDAAVRRQGECIGAVVVTADAEGEVDRQDAAVAERRVEEPSGNRRSRPKSWLDGAEGP